MVQVIEESITGKPNSMPTSKSKKALIVEDDLQIAELIGIHIGDLDFDFHIISDGQEAIDHISGNHQDYDIYLLDVMLPRVDGLDICKHIRKSSNAPIIMVTAKTEEIDKVLGLESGADDYIVKPFGVRELQARIKSVLRRSKMQNEVVVEKSDQLVFNDLHIDKDKRIVTKGDKRLDLTPKEFELLVLLASNPGKSFNRQSLLNRVWGYDFEGFEHTVNSHINRLRAKVEDNMAKPTYILTSWGYGYRFNEDL